MTKYTELELRCEARKAIRANARETGRPSIFAGFELHLEVNQHPCLVALGRRKDDESRFFVNIAI